MLSVPQDPQDVFSVSWSIFWWDFPEYKNHPAIWLPPWPWNPPFHMANFNTSWFPDIGIPPVLIHFNSMFPYKPSSNWGTTMAMEPPFHMANFHDFPPKPGRHAMVTVPWWTARSAAGLGDGHKILRYMDLSGGLSHGNTPKVGCFIGENLTKRFYNTKY